jgi:NADH-quinone oxidoreductase subunit A
MGFWHRPPRSVVSDYFPILVYSLAVLAFAVFSLWAPHLVAPRRSTTVKNMPYESGMDPIGDARQPLSIKFYLVAILFIVFDVELLYVYPWAVALRSDGGIPAEARIGVMVVMVSLIATLALAYAYAYRKGVFLWRNR